MSSSNIQFQQPDNYNSAFFNDYDLKKISFEIDNIRYEFDNKYMVWKTELVQEYDQFELNNQDQVTKKSHKQMTVRQQYEHNKKQIQELNLEVSKLQENISKYQEKLKISQEEHTNLINEYIKEHLETEKIKDARDKLEKLKKELGL